jgi:hypothetical protein
MPKSSGIPSSTEKPSMTRTPKIEPGVKVSRLES